MPSWLPESWKESLRNAATTLRARRSPSAAARSALRAFHRHQAEFGGDEESVGEDQQEGRTERHEQRGHAATAARNALRTGTAQVLQDGSSIAGKVSLLGLSWSPAGRAHRHGGKAVGGR